jgi:putative IMPACT (imprinted ancient) family translation regulator
MLKIPKSTKILAMSKPNLIHSNPIESHKSVFIGHSCKLTEVGEFKKIKDLLLEDKKVAKATHNIWAYRIINEKGNVVSGIKVKNIYCFFNL